MQRNRWWQIVGVIWCLGLINAVTASCQKKTLPVRIISYNIHHANPPSAANVINTDTIAGVIEKYQPDMVALQEVDVNTSRSGKELNEAKAIAEKAGMQYRFAKAIDYAGGNYGIAILSKYRFDSFAVHKLPSANARAEARVLAIGYFTTGKQVFAFACTHLDAEGDNSSRLLQMKVIDSILSHVKMPVILAGDLNSEPVNPVIGLLDQQFKRTCIDSCGNTFPSNRPVKIIDYIAIKKTVKSEVVRHEVLPEPFPSDHLPILAEVKIKAGKSKKK
jgi:endonuclease/exonuclease/phosphatase family metal-dependent hydrolase